MSAAPQDRPGRPATTPDVPPAPSSLAPLRRSNATGRVPRRSWFSLQTAPPSYEEACRMVHAFASRHPALYRWRLRLYLASIFFAHIAALALLVYLLFGFPGAFRESEFFAPVYAQPVLRWSCLGLVYLTFVPLVLLRLAAAFRGLTLPLPAPAGIPLAEQDAARLFRLLAEVCRGLDIQPPNRAVLSPDRVLEVRALPRRGLLGPAERVLVAGLPLLEELSPQQFRAQLAHELSHLATHNRRFGGRVLGLRTRLRALAQAAESSAAQRRFWACQADEALADILGNLLLRISPQILPAVRQHESEADAIAGAVAGREFAAAALVRRRLAAHALTQRFREECLRGAETAPCPPADLFSERAEAARGAFSDTQVHAWLRHELDLKDDLTDSHPPLWDRLRLFGYPLESLDDFRGFLEATRAQGELGETAARYFLGDSAERCREQFFREWCERQSQDWRLRFDTFEGLRRTAAEWPAAASEGSSSPATLWQIAVAIGNTESWRAARPVAQRILELDPAHGDANLLEGQLLLEDGDAAGLPFLERAMAADAASVVPACLLASRFLEARGESEAAAGYKTRAEECRRTEQALAQERAQVRATDTFCPPDCSDEVAAALLRAVERHSSHIRAAYLVKKHVPGGEKKPLHVLGIERKIFPYQNSARANRLLLRRLWEVPGLPSDLVVCVVSRSNRRLLRKWKSVPGALFWSPALERAMGHPPVLAVPQAPSAAPLLREPPAAQPMPVSHTPAPVK